MTELVRAGLFVVAEIDGELLVDERGRTLLLHASARPAQGETATIAGASYLIDTIIYPEADVPRLRLRSC